MRIVFDLDGTLLDSAKRHVTVLKRCLEIAGFSTIPFEKLNAYIDFKASGNTTKQYLLRRLRLDERQSNLIVSEWIKRIEKWEFLQTDVLFDDTLPVLDAFKSKKHSLYLASARQCERNLYRQIHFLNLDQYFDDIYCVSPQNAVHGKAEKVKQIGADLLVGDTETELKTAEETNIQYYILNRGFRNTEYWRKMGVDSFDSLLYLNTMVHSILTRKENRDNAVCEMDEKKD